MKTRDEIQSHLTDVLVETFELDPQQVTLDAELMSGLGLDSIDAVDMAVKIQEFTGRKPSFGELRNLVTLKDVVDLIESHLNESQQDTAASGQ